MNKKLLLAVIFTTMALGVKAQTTLTGRVVATPNTNWTPAYVYYDLAEVATTLGYADAAALATDLTAAFTGEAHSITIANVDANDTESTNYTANYWRLFGEEWKQVNYGCFWLNAINEVVDYGNGNVFWSQTDWNTETGKLIIGLGQMAYQNDNTGCAPGTYTAKTKFTNGVNCIILESILIVQATQESDLTIISEGSVYIQQTAHDANDWSSDYKWYWFDNSALLAAGATAEFITDNIATLLYTSDGTSLVNTHNSSGNGFWFKGSNETICVKTTEGMEFYVDHLICNNESWIGFYIGQGYGNLTAGQHRIAPLYIIYGNKAVKMNVVLDIAGYVFMDKGDNQTVFNKLNNQSDVTVYLSGRTLYKDGKWNTICLPFAVTSFTGTPLEGATVKELTSATFSDGTLTLNFSDDLTAIEEGKPYIIKWESGSNIVNPVFTGVSSTGVAASTISKDDGKVTFKGTYNAINYDAENKSVLFMGADNTLYYPQSGASIGACRAYFEVSSTGSLVKNFVLNFGEDEDRIDEVNCESVNSENTAIFNLAGQRLQKMQKGINIINGKKYIIK